MGQIQLPEKICPHCGLTFSWRKKWEKDWAQVKYCSKACASASGSRKTQHIESLMWEMVQERGRDKSICPSEVARAIDPEGNWRALMNEILNAGRRLSRQGKVKITQKGKVLDPDDVKGPVRIALRQTL